MTDDVSPTSIAGGDIDTARERHLQWIRRFGLVRNEVRLAQYESWRTTELSALIYPDAVGADLDVAVDTMGWFVLLDDQYDGVRRGRTDELRRMRDELLDCLAGRAPRPNSAPLVRAWADLCPRMLDGMSPVWHRRVIASWRELLDACVAESSLTADTPDAIEAYLTVRRAAVMGDYATVLLERVARCELPDDLWDHPRIARVRRCVADVTLLENDLHSLSRELARGDEINLAVLLQKTHGYTCAEALDNLRERERAALTQLSAEQRAVLGHDRTSSPGLASDPAVKFLAGAQSICSGLHVWYSAVTQRYVGAETDTSGADDFEDLFAPLSTRDPALLECHRVAHRPSLHDQEE